MSETTPQPGELLLRAWQLKVGGEAFFDGVARRFPDQAADLELLAAAEREAGAQVEPVARSSGLDLDAEAVTRGVLAYVETLEPDLDAILQQSAAQARNAADLYRQLGQAGAGRYQELARQLRTIEDAVIAFIDAIVDGSSDEQRSVLEAIAATK